MSVKGHLVERKRYRARFILKGPSIVKQKRVKTEPVSSGIRIRFSSEFTRKVFTRFTGIK